MSWHSTPLVGGEDVGELRRQVGERDRRREQRVERGIVKQVERGGKTAAIVPARRGATARPCRPGWRRACSRREWKASPSGTFTSSRRTRTAPAPSPRRRRAAARSQARPPTRWCGPRDRSRPGAASGAAKPAPNCARDRGARRVRYRPPSRACRASWRTAAPPAGPSTPAPTTAIRSAGPGAPSQMALSAVSMLAASTARSAGSPSGSGTIFSAGKVKHGLVRIKRKAEAAFQRRPGRPRRAPTIA